MGVASVCMHAYACVCELIIPTMCAKAAKRIYQEQVGARVPIGLASDDVKAFTRRMYTHRNGF